MDPSNFGGRLPPGAFTIRAPQAFGFGNAYQTPEVERTATTLLESVFRDLDNLYLQARPHAATYRWDNPIFDVLDWSRLMEERYLGAIRDMVKDTEYLVICLHSVTFKNLMRDASDEIWLSLVEKAYGFKDNLRIFAIMRGIPYAAQYQNSLLYPQSGPINLHPLAHFAHFPQARPGLFETDLKSDGDITRINIDSTPVIDLDENKYNRATFQAHARHRNWPHGWPYPHIPSWVGNKAIRPTFWPKCFSCEKTIIQAEEEADEHPMSQMCTCTMNEILGSSRPLVEIIQLPNLVGTIIAEFTGEFIPIQAHSDAKDDYSYDFRAPFLNQKEYREWDETDLNGKTTSILKASIEGNWTRFLNQKGGMFDGDVGNNCVFHQRCVGGKMRIVLSAKTDVEFGEELTVYYGDGYFDVGDTVVEDDHGLKKHKGWAWVPV